MKKMSIRDLKGTVEDRIPVRNVLVSVSDKAGLDELTRGIFEANDGVMFLSTGGTYTELAKLFGPNAADHLMQVSDYTEFPEMEGGLVKTLHPKIHAGLLGERNNSQHQEYLRNLGKTVKFGYTMNEGQPFSPKKVFDGEVGCSYEATITEGKPAVYIDLVVVNLYPFEKTVSTPGITFEKARGNIDIGGPTMVRAGAKNFPSCAVLCNPADYKSFLEDLRENDGCTTFTQRLALAQKAFETTAKYDSAIAPFIAEQIAGNLSGIVGCYKFSKDVAPAQQGE